MQQWHTIHGSSNIDKARYSRADGFLDIRFKQGGVYRYFGVPNQVYDGFVRAPSHGKYHARNIRNQYTYQRL